MSIQEHLERLGQTETTSKQREAALEQFREPHTGSREVTGDSRRHSDADAIRRHFGVAPYDPAPYLEAEHRSVLPDCFEHEWDAPPERSSGGTDFLARGKPGSGKSTFANHFATRQLEINGEPVVWRGSSSRSEWLPLAPWATLCLPAGADVSARLVPTDRSEEPISLHPFDLSTIVRDTIRYENPLDLLEQIRPGQFHVVYPDPSMTGCQELFEAADTKNYDEPPRGTLFGPEDPASHWWFAFVLARVEFVERATFMTLILDEIGDIAPQSASKDSFGSYQKIELLKDLWVDARKLGLTFGLFCHSEVDIHQLIRHKIRWRIQMPGTSNPTSPSGVVGFEEIPMNSAVTSHYPVGRALMYTETNFDRFEWPNYSASVPFKLKIELRGVR
jgi:hypothetical protein